MKTNQIILMTFAIIITEVKAQTTNCINANFELNSFEGWTAKTGNCCPVNMSLTGTVPGRHTIMSGVGTDPLSLGLIPYAPTGCGTYTARLGNSNTGAESEQLLYSFHVTEASALFIYKYAVVLQDPGHVPAEQPRFSIRVYDQTGDSIACGTYNVVADANIAGFVNNRTVRIKPWSTVGIQLSDYIGKTVTIEFTTSDCGLGGHFGYAYLECSAAPFEINSVICPGGNNIAVLNAPIGFANYSWSDGSTVSSITVANPQIETTYTCTMTSVTGCILTLDKTLMPVNFRAAFNASPIIGSEVTFTDASYVVAGSAINHWLWNFGDGNTSPHQNNIHDYSTGGFYTVQLVVVNEDGCTDTAAKNIATEYSCYFPNTFTPNNDGRNDFFNGVLSGEKVFRMYIYNRYGQMLFTTDNPSSSWNGTYKNHPVPEGTYIYKADITDLFDKTHLLAGIVNLVR
ncbi:MAG: T9SS type B sorting domain-containing protein [Bacteroidota bacterium]